MPTSDAPPLPAGTYTLGPGSATLTVHTRKGGAASKAGHDLTIEVTRWEAGIEVGDEVSMSLTADARSLRVREGHGGAFPLGDEEKASIEQSIDEEVLAGDPIEFRSTSVRVTPLGAGSTTAPGSTLAVDGELELGGTKRPLSFELALRDDGGLAGRATVRQRDWGIKPYSALFGTLKVLDEVEVEIEATLREGRSDG